MMPTLHRNALRQARRFVERALSHRLGHFAVLHPDDAPEYAAVCRTCGRQCIVHFPRTTNDIAPGTVLRIARSATGLSQTFAIGGRAVSGKCPDATATS